METAGSLRERMRKRYVASRSYLLQQNCRAQIRAGLVFGNRTRMTKEKENEAKKKKESDEVRDLPPKKDVKGGNSKEKGLSSTRTGEVDFMRDYD